MWECRSRSEVAGLSPDPNLLRSLRQELGGLWVTPLLGGAVFALQAHAGVLVPWGKDWQEKSTCISDRFGPRATHFTAFHSFSPEWESRSWCPRAEADREKIMYISARVRYLK